MDGLEIAERQLKEKKLSLVFVKNSKAIFETRTEGLRGFVQAIDELDGMLTGASVADKTIGKAAALLCVYANVAAAFAVTISRSGLETLNAYSIRCEYENLVSTILNRKKTDRCPFEKLVENTANPEEAYREIRHACNI